MPTNQSVGCSHCVFYVSSDHLQLYNLNRHGLLQRNLFIHPPFRIYFAIIPTFDIVRVKLLC